MSLRMACFPMQSCQGFSRFRLQFSSSVPLPSEAEIPAEAGSSPSLVGASPSESHGLEAHTTEAAHSSTSNI